MNSNGIDRVVDAAAPAAGETTKPAVASAKEVEKPTECSMAGVDRELCSSLITDAVATTTEHTYTKHAKDNWTRPLEASQTARTMDLSKVGVQPTTVRFSEENRSDFNNLQAGGDNGSPPQNLYGISSSLYVVNLDPDHVTETVLLGLFSSAGRILSARVCRDRATRRSRGCAYVNFAQQEDAERARDQLNFTVVYGRRIQVMYARTDCRGLSESSLDARLFVKNVPAVYESSLATASPTPHNATWSVTRSPAAVGDECELWMFVQFSRFGHLASCRIVRDPLTGAPRPYGYALFNNVEAASRALAALDGIVATPCGRKLCVSVFNRHRARTVAAASADAAVFPQQCWSSYDPAVQPSFITPVVAASAVPAAVATICGGDRSMWSTAVNPEATSAAAVTATPAAASIVDNGVYGWSGRNAPITWLTPSNVAPGVSLDDAFSRFGVTVDHTSGGTGVGDATADHTSEGIGVGDATAAGYEAQTGVTSSKICFNADRTLGSSNATDASSSAKSSIACPAVGLIACVDASAAAAGATATAADASAAAIRNTIADLSGKCLLWASDTAAALLPVAFSCNAARTQVRPAGRFTFNVSENESLSDVLKTYQSCGQLSSLWFVAGHVGGQTASAAIIEFADEDGLQNAVTHYNRRLQADTFTSDKDCSANCTVTESHIPTMSAIPNTGTPSVPAAPQAAAGLPPQPGVHWDAEDTCAFSVAIKDSPGASFPASADHATLCNSRQ